MKVIDPLQTIALATTSLTTQTTVDAHTPPWSRELMIHLEGSLLAQHHRPGTGTPLRSRLTAEEDAHCKARAASPRWVKSAASYG